MLGDDFNLSTSNSAYWYLASPYIYYKGGVEAAYTEVCKKAAEFLHAGVPVMCPIAHAHGIHKNSPVDLPNTHEFWVGFVDAPMIKNASGMIVLEMEGWDKSSGLMKELQYFEKVGLPVVHQAPDKPVEPWRFATRYM